MIARPWERTWKRPNFECEAEDADGQIYRWLTHAESENALRERLDREGYRVRVVASFDFTKWETRAKRRSGKVAEAVAKGERPTFDDSLWAELKFHFFELFGNKCAYCETPARASAAGDVEHYRPKKKVEEDGAHGGYYWLAYDVRNMLPSCEECNRSRGKLNHFPVKTGSRAYREADVLHEEPLLLNPYFDNPTEHLEFKADGIVKGTSDQGKISVPIYHLNRVPLLDARRTALKLFASDYKVRVLLSSSGDEDAIAGDSALQDYHDELASGVRPYSQTLIAALLRAVRRNIAKEKSFLRGLGRPA